MNKSNKFLAILKGDKKLFAILSGIALDGIVLIILVIAASIWYLS